MPFGTLCGRRALGKVRFTRRNDVGRDEKAERRPVEESERKVYSQ